MLVDVYTQDESFVRALADRLEPVNRLRHLRPHEDAAFPDDISHSLLVVDCRNTDKPLVGSLLAQAASRKGFVLFIVGASHEMREWEQATPDRSLLDFLVWPAPEQVLGTRLQLIRNHLARLGLPRSAFLYLTYNHHR